MAEAGQKQTLQIKENLMSLHSQTRPRSLRVEEETLIRSMLRSHKDSAALMLQVDVAMVDEMLDGGMGSLRFSSDKTRSLGAAVAEADYVDTDGVPVSIVVNVDQNGQLFELDIWKVNFLPLKCYPSPEKITITQLD